MSMKTKISLVIILHSIVCTNGMNNHLNAANPQPPGDPLTVPAVVETNADSDTYRWLFANWSDEMIMKSAIKIGRMSIFGYLLVLCTHAFLYGGPSLSILKWMQISENAWEYLDVSRVMLVTSILVIAYDIIFIFGHVPHIKNLLKTIGSRMYKFTLSFYLSFAIAGNLVYLFVLAASIGQAKMNSAQVGEAKPLDIIQYLRVINSVSIPEFAQAMLIFAYGAPFIIFPLLLLFTKRN